jgi:hypothetical protein
MSDHALPPPVTIRPEEFVTPPVIDVVRKRSLIIGIAGTLLSILAAFVSPAHFFRAYLVAYMLWLGVTLGCLAILMLQYLSGGTWGLIIRRQLQAASKQIPMMLLLFIPLIFGMVRLYPWADANRVAGDEILRHRAQVFDPKWWIARVIIYFVAWWVLGYGLTRLSEIRDNHPGNDYVWRRRFQKFAAPGLVVYGMTITFASIDWVMSLDPHWSSTMYGVLFIGGQALSALSFATAMTVLLARYEPMRRIIRPDYLVDLGKLMLAFVMLWAYFAFSQFLIYWSGNLPDEITWYLDRTKGGWQYIIAAIMLFHFGLPFVLLLSRGLKKKGRALAAVAGFILVMRVVDLFWLIEPNFKPLGEPQIPWAQLWMYVVLPVAMGGLWMAAFLTSLRSRPLLPLADPLLKQVLSEGGHGHGA